MHRRIRPTCLSPSRAEVSQNAYNLCLHRHDGRGNHRREGHVLGAGFFLPVRNDAPHSLTQRYHRLIGNIGLVHGNFVRVFDHSPGKGGVGGGQTDCRCLCLLVFEQCLRQSGTGILLLRFRARQEHFALDEHQLGCHDDEFGGQIQIHRLRLAEVRHVLVANQ